MKNNLFILTLFLLFCSNQFSLKAFQLSPKAQISIITGTPGEDLYAIFGHTGIRVYDSLYGLDIMYNYGTFDFDEPNFMGKFIQGRLNYAISKEDYKSFLAFYASQGRPVYEQILNINTNQKQAIVDFLENNYLPKNRFYLYDFFYDNCSTRVRDVLEKTLKEKLLFDTNPSVRKRNFRDFLENYLSEQWLNLGITLILGYPADKIPTYYQRMFLPDRLQDALSNAKIIDDKGQKIPLVLFTADVVKGLRVKTQTGIFNPYSVFWLLFIVFASVSYIGFKRNKHSFVLDANLFGLVGLIGIFFLGMWFLTDHKAVKYNWNIIWAMPTHFLIVWLFLKKSKPSWLSIYFGINTIIIAFILIAWFVFPQKLHHSLIPILLLLGIRSFKLYGFLKKI
ncbi:MAG: DUF4105 domain-containing protein [Bacteroidetes bacterium]|nr:MAG: DUF4105 domain-containing protein [Bacteroidota bacterium]